ncbi:Flavodoxin 1 [hydrothermal vent metagenome]|uniref:Flavodoxin 1 n=1 Tax=hydrothermal vent metagenome TaxID=652676 RepID=A0A3B0UKC3_9ZZZZ
MGKIGLFFGPLKGSVHRVADSIKIEMGEDNIEMVPVKNASSVDLEKYDKIIFGISTVGKDSWDSSFSSNDWGKFLPEVGKVDFSKKTVAIFGLGDHITYSNHFVNHIGLLARELMKRNAKIIGQVSTDGYEFDESEAVIDGRFIGLPIDEDFEPELTAGRVREWVGQIKPGFGL